MKKQLLREVLYIAAILVLIYFLFQVSCNKGKVEEQLKSHIKSEFSLKKKLTDSGDTIYQVQQKIVDMQTLLDAANLTLNQLRKQGIKKITEYVKVKEIVSIYDTIKLSDTIYIENPITFNRENKYYLLKGSLTASELIINPFEVYSYPVIKIGLEHLKYPQKLWKRGKSIIQVENYNPHIRIKEIESIKSKEKKPFFHRGIFKFLIGVGLGYCL